MSIWDEALTKDEYLRRLFAAKAVQRREDAHLSFEQKIEIVLTLQDASRELRDAWAIEAGDGAERR
jgi:hypothetical protein